MPASSLPSTLCVSFWPATGGEAPERRDERQQREQQEIDDELDLEAPPDPLPPYVSCSSLDPLLPIPHSSDVSALGGQSMRGIERLVAGALLVMAVTGTAVLARTSARGRRARAGAPPPEPAAQPCRRPAAGPWSRFPRRLHAGRRAHDAVAPGDDRARAAGRAARRSPLRPALLRLRLPHPSRPLPHHRPPRPPLPRHPRPHQPRRRG